MIENITVAGSAMATQRAAVCRVPLTPRAAKRHVDDCSVLPDAVAAI
jgi:hypothetical protein